MRQPKIVIVGAGLVGGSAALFTPYTVPGAEIALVDLEASRAEGQVLDLSHAAALLSERLAAQPSGAGSRADAVRNHLLYLSPEGLRALSVATHVKQNIRRCLPRHSGIVIRRGPGQALQSSQVVLIQARKPAEEGAEIARVELWALEVHRMSDSRDLYQAAVGHG